MLGVRHARRRTLFEVLARLLQVPASACTGTLVQLAFEAGRKLVMHEDKMTARSQTSYGVTDNVDRLLPTVSC